MKPKTKAQMASAVADRSGLSNADANRALDALADIVLEDLAIGGPGSATLAGLVKVDVVAQTARPERMGRNPATGEPILIAARPAKSRGKVRVRALKRLRDIL